MVTNKTKFQVENSYLLEQVENFDSYNGWKSQGRSVKKGEKQRSVLVKYGVRSYEDPITGEMIHEPKYKRCFGFHISQTI